MGIGIPGASNMRLTVTTSAPTPVTPYRGMRHLLAAVVALALSACAQVPAAGHAASAGGMQAAGLWGPGTPARAGIGGGPIATALPGDRLKDPGMVFGGEATAGARWIVFGDTRTLYLKAFDVARPGTLAFRPGELSLSIAGRAPGLDSPWAPEIVAVGDRAVLLYGDGEMPAPEPPRWATYRLHLADMPRAAFEAALAAGQSPRFTDRGPVHLDVAPFGAGDADFGVIDPHLFVNDRARAYLSYTVVRPGVPGRRPLEEFVRFRRVDPQDPARALGPDTPLYDGLAGGDADGVAEAADVVTIGKRTLAFVSLRPGDVDQRLVVADVGRDLGTPALDAWKPFRYAGGAPWMAKAVGSGGACVIEGRAYVVHQGLSRDGRFTLGWTTIETN